MYTQANGQVVNSTRPVFGANFGSNPYMKTLASSSYNSLQASLRYKPEIWQLPDRVHLREVIG